MSLSPAEHAAFHARGFHVVRQLLAPAAAARLGREIDGLHEVMATRPNPRVGISWEEHLAPGQPARIRQLMHSELVSPRLAALVTAPRVAAILGQLIGPEYILYHSKLMMKAARDGSFTPWHQDWAYWQSQSRQPTQINIMLSIDAATEANGAIRFVEGSHRQGPLEHQRSAAQSFGLGLPGDLDAYPSTLVETEPGDAVIFGALVIHGSGPNASPHDRRANTFAFDRPRNRLDATHPETIHPAASTLLFA